MRRLYRDNPGKGGVEGRVKCRVEGSRVEAEGSMARADNILCSTLGGTRCVSVDTAAPLEGKNCK